MDAAPELVALLRQIAADVHILAVAKSPAGGRNEDGALGDLLQAIAATAGAAAFSSSELVEHATLPTAATLRAAIVAAVGTVNPRRLGKTLRAIEGVEIGGLRIIREGLDREGVVWRVAEVTSALPLRTR